MLLSLLVSRPRRNRYRRRPSRLTALGKAVVAGTATAFLAIGWASQASRSPEPLVFEHGSEPESAVYPVSAPPRWPAVPSFGASRAPDAESTSDAASVADQEPLLDAASAPDQLEQAAEGSAVVTTQPVTLQPAAAMPGVAVDLVGPPAPQVIPSPLLPVPPTSRARFEQARSRATELATSVAGGSPAAVPAGPASADSRSGGAAGRARLAEWLEAGAALPGLSSVARTVGSERDPLTLGRVRVEYSLDEKLTQEVFEILRRGRVQRGVAIVIDPRTGRLLAYAATDSNVMPVERAYPAASIVKVVTAAAMLEQRPDPTSWDCVYQGNKYRLTERRLDRPKSGNRSTLEEALATSNNQCFSQWAIHGLGEPRLRRMLDLFGWSGRPAIGHAPGQVDPSASRYDLGQLGSGLDGVRVTPLHVASLASVLTDGRFVEPRWIDRVVDAEDHIVALPEKVTSRRVISPRTAENLRELMVATTKRGTARRAFRTRRGVPLLGPVEVAGKTGNLNGSNPSGRYEWFFGVAPADDPTIGVVVVQVHGSLWWARSSELAANILRSVFCEGAGCRAGLSSRFTDLPASARSPVLVTELDRPTRSARKSD